MRRALALLVLAAAAFLAASPAAAVTGFDPISTIAGSGTAGFRGDGGPATEARLAVPAGVAVGPDGSVYISDFHNHRIRRVSPGGEITTFAGTGDAGFSGDGGPAAEARLDLPSGLAIDGDGVLYVADRGNERVRRIGTDGVITTVAGNGRAGSRGDGGPATKARLDWPRGVAVDSSGNLYVTEILGARVRRVAPDGTISTVAGDGRPGGRGDGGPATEARLRNPSGVLAEPSGGLLIADLDNNRIRRVRDDGIIETVAGTGAPGFSGDGGPADASQLNRPADVARDATGRLYIAEYAGQRVRSVSPEGTISTVAGSGAAGESGDGGPAAAARLDQPIALTVDRSQSLLIADSGNHRVRRVANTIPDVGSAGVRCAPVPGRDEGSGGGRVRLGRGQILINQRISQAAIRRLNAVRGWLDAGIVGADVCGGAIGPDQLGPGIVTEQIPGNADPPPADPRPVTPAPPGRGSPGDVTVSARQLLINQRVSQAAVRRANALEERLDGGLTGGDVRVDALVPRNLQSNLGILRAAAADVPAPSRTEVAPGRPGDPGAVRVSAAQLRINQRISQAAVRRANALIDRLSAGLTADQFRDGTIVAANLSPELRAGP